MSIFIHHGNRLLKLETDLISTSLPDEETVAGGIEWLFDLSASGEISLASADPTALLEQLSDQLNLVEAAGGLIEDMSGKMLLIFRRGYWDLPKGKIDPGESPHSAAIREIEEETGIILSELGAPIPPTFHCYEWSGKRVLKKTHWFRFRYGGDPALRLQKEEDIEEGRWMTKSEVSSIRDQIYPSLWSVVDTFIT